MALSSATGGSKGKKMHKKRIKIILVIFFLPVILCPAANALGEAGGMPWERFSISLGGSNLLTSSNVRIGTNVLGGGIDVDVEEALNVDATQSSYKLGALYRIGESRRHRVSLSYFDLNRSGSVIIEEEIEIGDPPVVLPIGARVKTSYDLGILKTDYGYSFFMDERFNLSVSGGLFVVPIKLAVENQGTGEASKTDITAPLPVFGVGLDFAISPKWFIKQNLELFFLELGDFKGGILDTSLEVEWRAWENWGFAASIESLRLAVKSQSESEDIPGIDFIGDIKLSYIGMALYARYRF
jgi:hypothetical protein